MFPRLLIFGAFVVGVAKGLRYCDDCSKLSECEQAVNRIRVDKSSQMAATVKKAICGKDDDGLPKVCCSDFSEVEPRFQQLKDLTNDEKDIENHPNVSLLPEECGPIEGNRVVGGSVATPFEFPWMALIKYRYGGKFHFDCAGSVINSNYVLTAAHCIKQSIVGVRVGEFNTSTEIDCYGEGSLRHCFNSVQDIGISSTIVYKGYINIPTVGHFNDIALLRLRNPVNFDLNNVGAICLPVYDSLRDIDIAGEHGTVAGWGFTEQKAKSEVLLKVVVPIYSTQSCAAFYERNQGPGIISPRFKKILCAGEIGRDSCAGDSGGPLMIEGRYNGSYRVIQYGVVSFGPKACGSRTPGVYTDVRKYTKWILDTIKP